MHSWRGLLARGSGLVGSYRLTRRRTALNPDIALVRRLVSFRDITPFMITDEADSRLCASILAKTALLNRNNITRTRAYWDIYRDHPELHWALLAHMVSRNGGWNMTDLRGEWLPRMQTQATAENIFNMLESCNSLIFGDAFPQLLLYIESKSRQIDLSRLLPAFGVSSFMPPVWKSFWKERNPVSLSIALIVNEQNFIQSRVVEDAFYRDRVFDKMSFRVQPLLQLTQIVFPLIRYNQSPPLRLAGRIMENFTSLAERIQIGKSLYAMLFGYPDVLEGVVAFAESVVHTGSRADYWPHLFQSERFATKSGMPGNPERAAVKWDSPTLGEAWPDRPLVPWKKEDWFSVKSEMAEYLASIKIPRIIDITYEHHLAFRKLQTAALLARIFSKGASNRRTGRG